MNFKHPQRVFPIRLMTWIFLALSLVGWLRFGQVVSQWQYLNTLNFTPGPLYLALEGAVWGTVGILAFFGLICRKRWAVRFATLSGLFFALAYWLDRLVNWQYGSLPSNLVFAGAITMIGLILLFWGLRRPEARYYFGADHGSPERKLIGRHGEE